ncbi:hypothetical protein ACFOGG_14645 [Brenneria rubrifaciens]|uniref:hypothetical protein n=1 Tax=Brenneria rubrifaciens TaxID=55213 RepID=UPI0036228460
MISVKYALIWGKWGGNRTIYRLLVLRRRSSLLTLTAVRSIRSLKVGYLHHCLEPAQIAA